MWNEVKQNWRRRSEEGSGSIARNRAAAFRKPGTTFAADMEKLGNATTRHVVDEIYIEGLSSYV